jgi:hypothetical protein
MAKYTTCTYGNMIMKLLILHNRYLLILKKWFCINKQRRDENLNYAYSSKKEKEEGIID